MNKCPTCQRTVEAVRGRSRPPEGDDLVICMACGAICYFDTRLQLHLMTPADAKRFPSRLLLEAIAISDAVMQAPPPTKH